MMKEKSQNRQAERANQSDVFWSSSLVVRIKLYRLDEWQLSLVDIGSVGWSKRESNSSRPWGIRRIMIMLELAAQVWCWFAPLRHRYKRLLDTSSASRDPLKQIFFKDYPRIGCLEICLAAAPVMVR